MFKPLKTFFVKQLIFNCNDKEILSKQVLNFDCIFVKNKLKILINAVSE